MQVSRLETKIEEEHALQFSMYISPANCMHRVFQFVRNILYEAIIARTASHPNHCQSHNSWFFHNDSKMTMIMVYTSKLQIAKRLRRPQRGNTNVSNTHIEGFVDLFVWGVTHELLACVYEASMF